MPDALLTALGTIVVAALGLVGGWLAKRTPVEEYPTKGRATLGVKVATISERGGDLVGALVVENRGEVMVVMEKGKIVRSAVAEVRETGRNTQGVQFATPGKGDSIVAVARSVEQVGDEQVDAVASGDDVPAEAADGSTNDAEQTAGGTE